MRSIRLAFALSLYGLCAADVASGGTSTANLTVSATITASCDIAAGGSVVNFGTQSNITSNRDASTVISVQCTSGTPWSVGLNNGSNASGAQRRMTDGASHFINYDLYTDNPRTLPWTTTTAAGSCTSGAGSCVLGTGTGGFQFITIYGRVPFPQTPVVGLYTDTVVATVTY